MSAFDVTRYKGPLQEADVLEPVVGEHDVLLRVDAAGLNPLDEGIRAGGFKQVLPYRLPLIVGNDLAGTVIRVGAKVHGFKPTRCCAWRSPGSAARSVHRRRNSA
jgi:NADPH:quinone reductase-like Zn-dependent oxidoreductase